MQSFVLHRGYSSAVDMHFLEYLQTRTKVFGHTKLGPRKVNGHRTYAILSEWANIERSQLWPLTRDLQQDVAPCRITRKSYAVEAESCQTFPGSCQHCKKVFGVEYGSSE